jgi:DNA-binding NarL/FixJ family response regulator
MPYKNGHEVLQWILSQQSLCGLPVVVLISSNQDSDILGAYAGGVSGYLIKPGAPRELDSIARALKDFWLVHNRTTAEILNSANR